MSHIYHDLSLRSLMLSSVGQMRWDLLHTKLVKSFLLTVLAVVFCVDYYMRILCLTQWKLSKGNKQTNWMLKVWYSSCYKVMCRILSGFCPSWAYTDDLQRGDIQEASGCADCDEYWLWPVEGILLWKLYYIFFFFLYIFPVFSLFLIPTEKCIDGY